MFDFNWSEIALIGIVALVLIGPKDLPIAMRAVSNAIKKMRSMASELQGHVDEMVRDTDLKEARDTFRDLRSMNIRSQVMRTIDGDGAMRRTLTEKPLAGQNLFPTPEGGRGSITASGPAALIRKAEPVAADGAAPAFVPPQTARAMADAKAPPAPEPPPSFIPPSAG
jgi:sec-independent protein translocase protein TatB